jgi:hypothetical protein
LLVEGPSHDPEVTSKADTASDDEKGAVRTPEPEVGWWVVLASYNVVSGQPKIVSDVRHTTGAAHKCGSSARNDLSSKFDGFRPGYVVVVVGPFAIRADAVTSQQQVNACVSGTYLKYARRLEE